MTTPSCHLHSNIFLCFYCKGNDAMFSAADAIYYEFATKNKNKKQKHNNHTDFVGGFFCFCFCFCFFFAIFNIIRDFVIPESLLLPVVQNLQFCCSTWKLTWLYTTYLIRLFLLYIQCVTSDWLQRCQNAHRIMGKYRQTNPALYEITYMNMFLMT